MMHSVSIDRNGSPRKRTLSRGMSEDESLRSIITETECSSTGRRLARSESRNSIVKRRSESLDLYTTEVTDMEDLQVSYEEVVQELRGLEVERETLVFQVDLLRDTLGSVEELLAEAQREAREASVQLEQERGAKRQLEAMVRSLMRDVEGLKEERNVAPSGGWECSAQEVCAAGGEPATTSVSQAPQHRHGDGESSPTSAAARSDVSQAAQHRRGDPEPKNAGEATVAFEASPLRRFQKMLTDTLALDVHLRDGVIRRLHEGQAAVAAEGDGRDASPDRSNDADSTSGYEDAYGDTPDLELRESFPAELPHDDRDDEVDAADRLHSSAPTNADSCLLS